MCLLPGGAPQTVAFATVERGLLVLRRGALVLAEFTLPNLAVGQCAQDCTLTLKVPGSVAEASECVFLHCGDAARLEILSSMLASAGAST